MAVLEQTLPTNLLAFFLPTKLLSFLRLCRAYVALVNIRL